MKIFKNEFDEIKSIVKDFRMADDLFKKPLTRQYVMPGMKEERFAKLISFLLLNQSGQ